MAREVKVVPYDPKWQEQYQIESENLKRIFDGRVVRISHIGSTSVPGLSAKPIIDVLIEVHALETVDELNHVMVDAGYVPKGEAGIIGRRFFIKGTEDLRSHHVHVFEADHPDVTRHLAFRDYLIARPERAREYGELKETLAQQFPQDIQSYMDGKDALIKKMETLAMDWKKK